MLTIFDWLRRSRSGAELLATLEYAAVNPDIFQASEEIGPPPSAFDIPCRRCWIYPSVKSKTGKEYCEVCQAIVSKARSRGRVSRQAIVVWGGVTYIPGQLRAGKGFYADKRVKTYIEDDQHFLLVIARRDLKLWIQELLLYDGADMKGLIQIFPTTGEGQRSNMGEILCRVVHHEARFPMDMLRVRFFSGPYQVFSPHNRDGEGLLTFEMAEFLRLLEMAEVFRSLLRPEEQEALRELVSLNDPREEQFYWGRFTGRLKQEAKDMLNAWKIRQWHKNRIKLLYELADYVFYR
ncbi:hypothetical protein QUF80_18810 [Desulfococcaceae bacterium HSG8]|nr:hypothetical protein [Desulfococcaceae bacterium HSG8]